MMIDILPLEKIADIQLPDSLTGAQGQNREGLKPCLIPAMNDMQAVTIQLVTYRL